MYSHQVIDMIQEMSTDKKLLPVFKNLSQVYLTEILPKIRKSQKIYLGKLNSLVDLFKDKTELVNDFSELRLPFKTCWFDLDCDVIRTITSAENLEWSKAPYNITKRGILCEEIFGHDEICIYYFNYIKELQRWEYSSQITFQSMNDIPLILHKDFVEFMKKLDGNLIDLNCLTSHQFIADITEISKNHGITEEVLISRVMKNTISSYYMLNLGLRLLQCKNIVTVNNPQPDRLNKKREKNGKEPIHVFKTLMVRPLKYLSNSKAEPSKGLMKVHLAMGHFKTYTKEKPLFGKYFGKFWWEAQVRGDIKNGSVIKDYHLLTK
jgi:hypothetical protein